VTREEQRVKQEKRDHRMPVPIKVNSMDVVTTPLFDMQYKETLHNYRKGLRCRIQSESGQCSIRELVSSPKRATRTHFFDQQRQQWQAETVAAMKAYLAAHKLLQESQIQDIERLAPVPVLVVEYTA
jgi:hypothetical protein